MIITLDGLSRSGKSTITEALAKKLAERPGSSIRTIHPFDCNDYGKHIRAMWRGASLEQVANCHNIAGYVAGAFYTDGCDVIHNRSPFSIYEFQMYVGDDREIEFVLDSQLEDGTVINRFFIVRGGDMRLVDKAKECGLTIVANDGTIEQAVERILSLCK